jgi:hypothetical protein
VSKQERHTRRSTHAPTLARTKNTTARHAGRTELEGAQGNAGTDGCVAVVDSSCIRCHRGAQGPAAASKSAWTSDGASQCPCAAWGGRESVQVRHRRRGIEWPRERENDKLRERGSISERAEQRYMEVGRPRRSQLPDAAHTRTVDYAKGECTKGGCLAAMLRRSAPTSQTEKGEY